MDTASKERTGYRSQRRQRPLTIALTLLVIMLSACGDGVVFFSVNLGVVAGTPVCGKNDGHFDLQDQGGLIILVVLTSDSHISAANGNSAQCTDIAANAQVQVRGPRDGSTVTAKTVQIL